MADRDVTKPVNREGLRAYFVQFLNGEHGEASAEVLTDVLLLAVSEEREACGRLAENPCGDEVRALAGDEPKKVGTLIADAIRARGEAEKGGDG